MDQDRISIVGSLDGTLNAGVCLAAIKRYFPGNAET